MIYYFLHLGLLGDFERDATYKHLVGDDADGPVVDFVVVLVTLKDVRGEVERSSAEGLSKTILVVHCPTEITYF